MSIPEHEERSTKCQRVEGRGKVVPVRVRESVRRDTGVGGQRTMQMWEAEMEVWAGQANES